MTSTAMPTDMTVPPVAPTFMRRFVSMSAAFVFLVPLYFVYHWLARIELIPLFLGGYSNESSVTVIALAVALAAVRPRTANSRPKISSIELIFFTALLYFLFTILYHSALATSPDVSVSQFAALLQLLAIFLVFRFADFKSIGLRRTLATLAVVMSLLVYEAAESDALSLLLGGVSETSGKGATYQGLARVLLLTVCMSVPFLQNSLARTLGYCNAAAALFLLGARSEVAALVLFVWIVGFCEAKRKDLAIALIVITAAVLYLLLGSLSDWLPDNRVSALLEVTDDASFQERASQIHFATNSIADNPFFGSYGSYTAIGGPGSYAHNLLSAWVDLGLIGFALFVTLLLACAIWYLPTLSRTTYSSDRFIRKMLFIGAAQFVVTAFLLITAKPFSDIAIAALIGITGQLQYRLRESNGELKHTGESEIPPSSALQT